MTQTTMTDDDHLPGARTLWAPQDVVPEETVRAEVADARAGDGIARHEVAAQVDSPGRSRWSYFWTWLVTPHIEFGAIYVGMIVVLFLDMSLAQALIGVILGTAFGAFTHGLLTANGVRLRVPQMALGVLAFGTKGNRAVTTVMALISSVGWFIVNSVVAGLALAALFDFSRLGALGIVVVVQLIIAVLARQVSAMSFRAIQRYLFPVISLLILITGIVTFTKVDLAADPGMKWNLNGLIAIVVVACFAWAYTIGWAPFATDYSKYLPKSVSPREAGIGAAAGLFAATALLISIGVCTGIVLEGAGNHDTANPTAQFTSVLPGWFADIVLIALILGPLVNNSISLRSASKVFTEGSLGLSPAARAMVAPVLMSLAAFFLGWAAFGDLPANYEGFVMVIGVWVGPWLNVILIDQYIKRKADVTSLLYSEAESYKWGLFAVAFGLIASICLWSVQVVDDGGMPHGGHTYMALGMLAGFYLCVIVYSIGVKRIVKEHTAAQAK